MGSFPDYLSDRTRLIPWLRHVLRRADVEDYEVDRLIPRKDAFDLRILVTGGDGTSRAVPLYVTPAVAVVPDGSLALGAWRVVFLDPLADERLLIARALDRGVLDEVGRMLGQAITDASLHSYAPGRRAVIRYQAIDGSQHFGKVYRAGRSHDALRTVWQLRNAGLADWLPEPTGHLPELELVVWRGVGGRYLRELYPGSGYRAGLCLAASALRRLHDTDAAIDARSAASEGRSLGDELAVASAYCDRVATLTGTRHVDLDRFCSMLARRLRRAWSVPHCTVHGDFHDNQISVADGRAVLLDLDQLGRGDPAIDVGNLLAHIDFRIAYEQTPDDPEPYARELLRGYGQLGGDSGAERIACSHALSLLRNCCLYVLHPRRLQALTTACRRALGTPGTVSTQTPGQPGL